MIARGRKPISQKIYLYTQRRNNHNIVSHGKWGMRQLCAWSMDKIIQEYHIMNKTYADVINITNDPERLRGAWQEYSAHRKAQEEISRIYGPQQLLDAMFSITGKYPKAIETDDWETTSTLSSADVSMCVKVFNNKARSAELKHEISTFDEEMMRKKIRKQPTSCQ
jgi:hypothetical protein